MYDMYMQHDIILYETFGVIEIEDVVWSATLIKLQQSATNLSPQILFLQVNNYMVRSYTYVIVVTNIVTKRISKA